MSERGYYGKMPMKEWRGIQKGRAWTERYVALRCPTRAVVFESEWGYSATAHEVFIEDDTPIATGILNTQGVQLYRYQDRGPVGFAAEKLSR